MNGEECYWKIATRQMPLVSKDEQLKFKRAKIAVIGCGGIGGETIEMLARMGVGELVLVDEDEFDVTNLNRQSLSTTETIGHKKSAIAKEKINLINPHTKVTNYNAHVDETNIDEIIGDSNLVIDALDNVLTRVIVSRKANYKKIPYVHGAVHGTLGQVTVFLPNTKSYEELFNLPSFNKELTEDVIEELKNITSGTPPVIGPTPNLIACIEAMEAYKIITGIGKVTVAPKILTFDLLNLGSFSLEEL